MPYKAPSTKSPAITVGNALDQIDRELYGLGPDEEIVARVEIPDLEQATADPKEEG